MLRIIWDKTCNDRKSDTYTNKNGVRMSLETHKKCAIHLYFFAISLCRVENVVCVMRQTLLYINN